MRLQRTAFWGGGGGFCNGSVPRYERSVWSLVLVTHNTVAHVSEFVPWDFSPRLRYPGGPAVLQKRLSEYSHLSDISSNKLNSLNGLLVLSGVVSYCVWNDAV